MIPGLRSRGVLILRTLVRCAGAFCLIVTVNFALPLAMPGDPAMNLLAEDSRADADLVASLRREMGLDAPLSVQYLRYWGRVLSADLGNSYILHQPVANLIRPRAGRTLSIALPALLIGAVVGGLFGSFAGLKPQSPGSAVSSSIFLVLRSAPPYFLSLILLYLFAYIWGLVPLKSFGTSGEFLRLLLPRAILTLSVAAGTFLVARASVAEETRKPYVLYGRSKGLRNSELLFSHILRNSLPPVISALAIDISFLLGGAILVEVVFSLNGMGSLISEAVSSRDYPVLQGSLLVITIMVIGSNLAADIINTFIDPRVKQR